LRLSLFVEPEHQPFLLPGGKPGAVLVHGFGGTPAEVRALGQVLNDAGWTVSGPRLPGFGSDLPTLPERRYADWLAAVQEAVQSLRHAGHAPILLAGYSLGGTIALALAPAARPDGVVLLAPFWWGERPALKVVGEAVRPFLPATFRPLRGVNFADPRMREFFGRYLPGADLDDPAVQQNLRDLRVPVALIEQIRDISQLAGSSASEVATPTLIIQGQSDQVSRPRLTRQLAMRFPQTPRYITVTAGHHIMSPNGAAWSEIITAVGLFGNALIHST
jgi:carboxylesterase